MKPDPKSIKRLIEKWSEVINYNRVDKNEFRPSQQKLSNMHINTVGKKDSHKD